MAASIVAPRCRMLRVPRQGHALEDCQDACAFAPERGCVAVADGAAESAFSGLWAQMLVEGFVEGGCQDSWPNWIRPLQAQWTEKARFSEQPDALPWYLENRYVQGAFSTFLGLTLDATTWRAVAVGDTCLFQVRDDQLRLSFPIPHSSRFDNSPWLIGSRSPVEGIATCRAAHLMGEYQAGDRIWLMTDALARWFLQEQEADGKPWTNLESLLQAPEECFVDWVEIQRSRRHLRNDDTTLVALWM